MNTKRNFPLIVAHRGASALAPENTLAAFKLAMDAGAEGIEFDVRLSKDNVAVVHHDRTLNRTAGRDGEVRSFTVRQLSQVDVGTWFNDAEPKMATSEFAKQKVPTLAETLAFLKDFRGLIYIELKCKEADVAALAKAVCNAISESSLAAQIVVKSFKLSFIPHIRHHCPGIRTAALFAPKIMTILRKEKHLVKIAEGFGADELSIHYSLATQKLIENAEHRNLPVNIWTADHPRWLKRGVKLGLNAIITNDPARLLATRRELLG